MWKQWISVYVNIYGAVPSEPSKVIITDSSLQIDILSTEIVAVGSAKKEMNLSLLKFEYVFKRIPQIRKKDISEILFLRVIAFLKNFMLK